MPFDLYIVDNGSDKETVAYLRRLNKEGTAGIGLNDRNAGWMVAKNQCMAVIKDYDVQVLLENDGNLPVAGPRAGLVAASPGCDEGAWAADPAWTWVTYPGLIQNDLPDRQIT